MRLKYPVSFLREDWIFSVLKDWRITFAKAFKSINFCYLASTLFSITLGASNPNNRCSLLFQVTSIASSFISATNSGRPEIGIKNKISALQEGNRRCPPHRSQGKRHAEVRDVTQATSVPSSLGTRRTGAQQEEKRRASTRTSRFDTIRP